MITKNQARRITMDSAVEPYGTMYDDRYKKIARQAFLDGMVFWDMVKAGVVSEDMIDDSKGFLLFCYAKLESGANENGFASHGRLDSMAECLYACMKQNEMLANIVIAASNAIVQGRMMEAQIQAQAMEQNSTETKKKRTRKPKN